MNLRLFNAQGLHAADSDNLEWLIQTSPDVIWIDLDNPADTQLDMLRDLFRFHHLAIEDTRNHRQRPKVEEYADHLFIIANHVVMNGQDVEFQELDIFLGKNYIVTVHSACSPLINEVCRRLERMTLFKHDSSEYLLYMIIDTVVDGFLPVLDRIDDEIETLGEQMVLRPNEMMLEQVFQQRRTLNEMWHIVSQQLSMFNILTRHEEDLLTHHDALRYYLRDVQDHLIRINDITHMLREQLGNIVDLYVSANSHRLNLVVNRLAVITVLIGVLTVISGFYGMNFVHLWPPLDSVWGLRLVVAAMVGLLAVVALVFRRLKWY